MHHISRVFLWLALLLLAGSVNGQDLGSQFEFQIGQAVGDGIERQVEAQVEGLIEQQLEAQVEQRLNQSVQIRVESNLENRIEDQLEIDLESLVEQKIENNLDSQLDEILEQHLEMRVTNILQARFDHQQRIEAFLEEHLENNLQNQIEGHLTGEANRKLENNLNVRLERILERTMSRRFDDNNLRANVGANLGIDSSHFDVIDGDVMDGDVIDGDAISRDAINKKIESSQAEALFKAQTSTYPTRVDKHSGPELEQTFAHIEEKIEMAINRQGEAIAKDHWLIMAAHTAIAGLIKQGFVVEEEQKLEGIGKTLFRVQTPSNVTLNTVAKASRSDLVIDYDHFYQLNAQEGVKPAFPQMNPASSGLSPNSAYAFVASDELRLGMIDTSIQQDHPALNNAKLTEKSFVPSNHKQPTQHGTTVGSILVGQSADFQGIAPEATLFSAAVFEFTQHSTTQETQPLARTQSLVQGLDWLVQQNTPVINMSLSGPPNRILEETILLAQKKGIIIVAAVGNHGPSSPPLFPAAYDNVIAVTAISHKKRIYRKAVRGKHVDFSAFGVNVRHADASTHGYSTSSGTSMAVPFVTVMIASAQQLFRQPQSQLQQSQLQQPQLQQPQLQQPQLQSQLQPQASQKQPSQEQSSQQWLIQQFVTQADDLGKQGHDEIYGYGMIHPLQSTAIKSQPAMIGKL